MLINSNANYNSYFNSQYASRQKTIDSIAALQKVSSIQADSFVPFDISRQLSAFKTNSASNVYGQRSASVSNPNALAVSVKNNASPASYRIGVSQLATAQINTGKSLAKGNAADGGFTAGINRFSIQTGNGSRFLSVDVKAGDTNSDVLNKMADKINFAQAGVTAKTVTDDKGASRLMITANKTGSMQEFSLKDVSGNAVAVAGANQVSTAATNAAYTVNGIKRSSQSNVIALDNGKVEMTLKKVTDSQETAKISAAKGASVGGISAMEAWQRALSTMKNTKNAFGGMLDVNI